MVIKQAVVGDGAPGSAPHAAPPPSALYVHFPFCLSICPYCDFVVYPGRAARGPEAQIDRFVDAVLAEIWLRARPGSDLGSVYLGGGTPSLLTAGQVARLLAAVDAAFAIRHDAEITVEVNPGPGERGDLAGFRAAGVTRVSIGAQSLDAQELQRLGRRHTAGDVAQTVAAARAAGFRSVSLDLLYDVPGQTIAAWRASLDGTLALAPDHVSAYALTLAADGEVSGTDHLPPRPGATRWRARARLEQDEDRAADMYELADDVLARAGLPWYEISNWARPGHESGHNLTYWRSQPWEAVGPGAHRFDGIATRSWNSARLDAYMAALEEGRLPPGESVSSITDGERVMLRLRISEGVPATEVPSSAAPALEWARTNGLVQARQGCLRLTRRGRLLSNEVFSRLA